MERFLSFVGATWLLIPMLAASPISPSSPPRGHVTPALLGA
jgi:hypothetical protein